VPRNFVPSASASMAGNLDDKKTSNVNYLVDTTNGWF